MTFPTDSGAAATPAASVELRGRVFRKTRAGPGLPVKSDRVVASFRQPPLRGS